MPRKSQTRATVVEEAPSDDVFTKNKIALDELIKVVSLIDYPLNLLPQGQNAGGRAKYRFEKFGEAKQVIYQDILQIIEQYRSFMETGKFMILDPRVIARHGLHEIQSKVLSKESLEKILDGSKEAVEIFKSSGEEQQKTIIGMLTRRLAADPKSVDLNVVDEISRYAKVNIQQNAEESRELFTKQETE